MDRPVIGFIGLGFMGHGMAKNILKGGYPLWVRGNVNRTPIDSLVALGAQEAASPADMAARCDIIHICLGNSKQVEAVIRGPEGILAAARPGLIVIDTTTADPVSTLALAAEMAAQGVHMVDAPLGRTPKEAEDGTLDAMVGCDEALMKTITPVIDCWAGTITRIGPVGAGHKMKLLMNFLGGAYAALYSEAVVLGARVGISPHTFREVIGPSRLGSGFFATFMQYVCERDENAHKFSIANLSKDMRYVNAMATEAGVVNIMASAARHYYTHAEAQGAGQDFVPMLSNHVGALNGLDMDEVTRK
ncbi:NAD(P)-dependent oxidoreductase [Ruegeria pomeroyi]|uniref:3-hydroxyisobutyrate dehydrogenase family protein n=2 Tax=Ruegeria pomeroyi TaxID=89184 RepID=Q5LQS2_RUEPO|nr:NAD(P)-dependent oxidoreductase [Ruegeria pomeroyi]AAV95670.1 3-hydroxyisobutyrate dehydrogenase family protein [Ruegeria pomeroyi DSS-3]NVK99008.1 NAD(P)-dependent oxidoreductase [Ruegeria pomeroyi]NVL03050.1 NAD(P)-dependent oxidoreductase [Ruegeria pomeroyi]QWV09256.1 NAD(P)-dependent oxidoreductase [Ruegeria pomeroyi]